MDSTNLIGLLVSAANALDADCGPIDDRARVLLMEDLRSAAEKLKDMKRQWWVARIVKAPTNHNESFRVAVEAAIREDAIRRLEVLYPFHYYADDARQITRGMSMEPETDPDVLETCIKHPLR